jgi:hypothetical protein
MEQLITTLRANPSAAVALGFVLVAVLLWVFDRALHRN